MIKITLHLFRLASVQYVVVKHAFLKVKVICRCEHKFRSDNSEVLYVEDVYLMHLSATKFSFSCLELRVNLGEI